MVVVVVGGGGDGLGAPHRVHCVGGKGAVVSLLRMEMVFSNAALRPAAFLLGPASSPMVAGWDPASKRYS